MAPFHDLDDAALDQLVRGQLVDALALVFDRTLGHIAALGMQQIGDRLQGRRFPGAVGTEQGDDLAFRHVQRHPLEHQDHVVVDDLDVVDAQVVFARRSGSLCSHMRPYISPPLQGGEGGVSQSTALCRLNGLAMQSQPSGRGGDGLSGKPNPSPS